MSQSFRFVSTAFAWMVLVGIGASGVAHAGMAPLRATCGPGVLVRTDAAGVVFINGRKAVLTTPAENYYEARDAASGVTVSLSYIPGSPPDLSYTNRQQIPGVCTLLVADAGPKPAASAPAAPERAVAPERAAATDLAAQTRVAQKACVVAGARAAQVRRPQLQVVDTVSTPTGVRVTFHAPGSAAPWTCQVNHQGIVTRVTNGRG